MTEENVITQQNFDLLLGWLDDDREIAAEKYEKLRARLITIFRRRGCFEAEDLADETFNRVERKLPAIIDDYTGEPALYFYGVANKVHLEWTRKQDKIREIILPENETVDTAAREAEYCCIENCLDKLPAADRRLIVEYYRREKGEKIDNRRRLAERLGLSANALQVKAHRLRTRLRDCVRNCVGGKDSR